jgi:hypothetical protein
MAMINTFIRQHCKYCFFPAKAGKCSDSIHYLQIKPTGMKTDTILS